MSSMFMRLCTCISVFSAVLPALYERGDQYVQYVHETVYMYFSVRCCVASAVRER